MFCVGAGRRVIMSHCYSRHSSTVCTPSLCRVSLHPAHPFPGISHPRARSPPRVYPRSLDPRATRHGAVRRVERLCFYLRRRAILWTLSQRRNQRRVTCGNGRKEEGSDRHFQARFTKRRQKRCQTIIPENRHGQTNGIMDESFKRECYIYDFLSKRVSPARVFYPIKCAQTEGLRATCFYVFFSGESLRLVYLV